MSRRGEIAQLARAIELSQRHGSPVAFGTFSLARGTAHYLRGELLEALADLDGASSTHGEGDEQGLPETLAFLALWPDRTRRSGRAARVLELPGDQERTGGAGPFRS